MSTYDLVKSEAVKKKLSIHKLEQMVGISNGTISRWRGKGQPRANTLKKISEILGVPMEQLVGDE